MNFKNKHIYITGSNRGIGLAFAKYAAGLGSHLHLLNRSSINNEAKQELHTLGAASIEEISIDLLKREDIDDVLESLKVKQIDVFINNAGLLTGGLIEDQPLDDIYKMIQVNVSALIHLSRGLVPILLKQKSGVIVNNASVSGKMFFPCASTYAASKAAVVAFTECLSQELKGTGASTLLVVTGGVKTEMYDDIKSLYGSNLDLSFLNSIPGNEWAQSVFNSLAKGHRVCWPPGSSRLGVWFGHHFPTLFQSAIRKKFKR